MIPDDSTQTSPEPEASNETPNPSYSEAAIPDNERTTLFPTADEATSVFEGAALLPRDNEVTLIFDTSEAVAPPPEPEAPPRIVAETPLGGRPKPLSPTPSESAPPAPAPSEAKPSVPTPQDLEKLSAAETMMFSNMPLELHPSEMPTQPEGVSTAEPTMFSDRPLDLRPSEIPTQPEGVSTAGPTMFSDRPLDLRPSEMPTLPEGVPTADALRRMEAEATPAPPPSRPASVVRAVDTPAKPAPPSDWDDEISPELATVLFGAHELEAPDSPPASRSARPLAAPVRGDQRTMPAVPDAAPREIMLTDTADARRLPLVAEGHSAPAPESTLTGQARYVRIEEPLSGSRGQSTVETWDYLKPNYPSLAGRLVKRVKIQEYAYADGSWHWEYEREYTDGGRDRREVRASLDRSYIERKDEVSTRDRKTDKRQQFREQATLILAEPEQEEKRSLLSSLFGRGGDDEPRGAKAWRPASGAEAKRARKQGGQAF